MKTYRPELAAGLALAVAAAVTLFGAAREGAGPEVAEAAGTCQVQQTFTVARASSEAARQRFLSGEWSAWVFYRLNNVEQPPVKLAVDATGVVFSQALQVAVPDPAGADLTWRYTFYGSATINPNNPDRSLLYFDSGVLPGEPPQHLGCGGSNLSTAVAVATPVTLMGVLEDPDGDGIIDPFEFPPLVPAGSWKVTATSDAGEAISLTVDSFDGTAVATLDYLFSWRLSVNRPPNWVQTYPKGSSGYTQVRGDTNPQAKYFGMHHQSSR